MGDVTGPTSSLPGSRHKLPVGAMCDQHPNKPAVARIQGETDSFGSELNDLCQTCLDEMAAQVEQARTGMCEWCNKSAVDLTNRRDVDEGMSGRVYRVCGACRRAELESLEEELSSSRRGFLHFED